jgi:tyrosinase
MSLSRRTFIAAAAAGVAVPFREWLGLPALADDATPLRVRYGAHTDNGQRNVGLYETAVGLLQGQSARNESNLTGWTAQAKVHKYPDNWDLLGTPDQATAGQKLELDSIFFPDSPEMRTRRGYAEKVWGQCPHGMPDFFPWHRMYLLCLEKILRQVVEDDTFTLPYWAYSNPDQRRLPDAFIDPTINNTENHLWYARNVMINSPSVRAPIPDQSIDTPAPADSYWASPDFETFAARAERTPHNRVHVAVGTNEYEGFDMLTIARAPRDPIFYMHHCEIDRIWFSWSEAGRPDPSAKAPWLDNTYYFVDPQGVLVTFKGRDVLRTSDLGYVYDTAIAPRTEAVAVPALAAQINNERLTEVQNVEVPQSGASIPLQTDKLRTQADVFAAGSKTRTFLTLEGLHTTVTVSANLDIYLSVAGDGAGQRRRILIGSPGLFGLNSSMMPMTMGANGASADFTFEITDALRKLGVEKLTDPIVEIDVAAGTLRGSTLRFDKMYIWTTQTGVTS